MNYFNPQGKYVLTKEGGQTLVELILVITLITILLPALLAGFLAARNGKSQQQQRLQASALLKEAEEATRSVRESGWNNIFSLPTGQDHHPHVNGGHWQITSGEETVNGYQRKLVFEPVFRDALGNMVPFGNLDSSTRRVKATVSWGYPLASHVESVFYLSRALDNKVIVDTTQSDFDAGTKTDVMVTKVADGEVKLDLNNDNGDWCANPPKVVHTADLSHNGIARSIWAVPGKAYVGTGDNASGFDAAGISITHPPRPADPDSLPIWSYNDDQVKTNDIFSDNNYTYISTNRNSEEVIVLDSNGNKISSFDILNNTSSAVGVFVNNSIGFALVDNKIYTFDANSANFTNNFSRGIDKNFQLGGNGKGIKVLNLPGGTFAFVAIDSPGGQMEIWKVNDINNLQKITTYSVSGGNGRDLDVSPDGSRISLVTSSGGNDFFILNSENLTSPSLVSANTVPKGTNPIRVNLILSKKRAIVVGDGSSTYWVYNIEDENNPIVCGEQTSGKIYDVSSVIETDGRAYSYVVTDDQDAELQIIEGGAGHQMAFNGEFESQTLPIPALTESVLFNRLKANFDQPLDSSLKFKVAVTGQTAGSCASLNFNDKYVGPSGNPSSTDPNDYFLSSTSGPVSLSFPIPMVTNSGYNNPGLCFRYKTFLKSSSNHLQSPVLKDVTINYSP